MHNLTDLCMHTEASKKKKKSNSNLSEIGYELDLDTYIRSPIRFGYRCKYVCSLTELQHLRKNILFYFVILSAVHSENSTVYCQTMARLS